MPTTPPPIQSLAPKPPSRCQKDDSPKLTSDSSISVIDNQQPPTQGVASPGASRESTSEVAIVSRPESPLDEGYSETSSSSGTRGVEHSGPDGSTGSSLQLSGPGSIDLERTETKQDLSTSSSLGSTDLEQGEMPQNQSSGSTLGSTDLEETGTQLEPKQNAKRVHLGEADGDTASDDGDCPSPTTFPPTKRFHVEVSTPEFSSTGVTGRSTGLTTEVRRVVIREDDNTFLSDCMTPDMQRTLAEEDSGSFRISSVNLKSSGESK